VWQTDRQTDRQTYGRTDILLRHSPRYAYASSGKNDTGHESGFQDYSEFGSVCPPVRSQNVVDLLYHVKMLYVNLRNLFHCCNFFSFFCWFLLYFLFSAFYHITMNKNAYIILSASIIFPRVSWKSAGDFWEMLISPKIPYSAMVREVGRWSGTRSPSKVNQFFITPSFKEIGELLLQ